MRILLLLTLVILSGVTLQGAVTKTWQSNSIYFSGAANPTTTAVNASKGTIFFSTTTNQTYLKQDQGFTTHWQCITCSSGGSIAMGNVGASPNAQGGTISSGILTLQPANASFPGVLKAADWITFNGKQDPLTIGDLSDPGTDGIIITGGVSSVIGGGTSVAQHVADSTHNGYLSSSNWSTFNGKQNALTIGSLTDVGTDGIVVTGGSNSVIGSGTSLSQHVGDTTHNGYISSTDWNTFNGKQAALTIGDFTDVGTDGITVTGGTGSIIGSGTSISQHVSDSTHAGYLSSGDWSTFNSKQSALTPGSISTSTTGVSVGSGSSSTIGPNVTVNVQTASGSQPGLLSSADWTTFNSKQSSLSFTAPLVNTTGTVSCNASSGSQAGCLSSADWTTFNNKQSTLTLGDLTDAGTDGITVTSGTGAVVGAGTSLSQRVADSTHNGYLSSTDWGTFNGKQASGSYITALTSDVTASGPGSAAATIAAGVVTNAKLATVGTATFKGRTTSGTGAPEDLTVTQATALLNVMTGDAGSGGLKGLVPAQATGDATKFLRGDGTWATGGSGANTALSNLASVAINTALLDGTAGADDIGSATKPFKGAWLAGTSGTPGTNNFNITGASTSGTRTITLPDASGTLLYSGGALGTPSSGTLSSATGLPISTGVSGLGTGVATWLATPSSANLLAAITDETGTGVAVFGTAPTFTTSILSPIVYGSAASGGNLTLNSTSHATKGKIMLGASSAFDEVNNRLGIGITNPGATFDMYVTKSVNTGVYYLAENTAAGSAAQEGYRMYDDGGNFTQLVRYNGSHSAYGAAVAGDTVWDTSSGALVIMSEQGSGLGIIKFAAGSNAEKFRMDTSGNFLIGATAGGTSIAKGIVMVNGTAPSTSPATQTQIWAAATATSNSNLYTRNEAGKVEQITGLKTRVSTQFDKTTSTALANVTGLSANLEAGKWYSFRAVLFFDADAVGGHQYAMAGTATATSIIYNINSLCNASNVYVITSRQTALAGAAGQAACTGGFTEIIGNIVVNAAGTFTVQFAQNASNGTSSILVGSYLEIIPIGS